jgi:hypothetical protein
MNKKQMVVLWIGGLFLASAFVISTYTFWQEHSVQVSSGFPALDELTNRASNETAGWHLSKTSRFDVIGSNLIRYMPPILIISGLLIYSLKSKNDDCSKKLSPDKKSS